MAKIIDKYIELNKTGWRKGAEAGQKTADFFNNMSKKTEAIASLILCIFSVAYILFSLGNFLFTEKNPIINILLSTGLFYVIYVLYVNIKAHIETIKGGV